MPPDAARAFLLLEIPHMPLDFPHVEGLPYQVDIASCTFPVRRLGWVQGGEMGLVVDILRKAASYAVTVAILLCVIFLTFQVLPGDPVSSMLPRNLNEELRQRIIDEMRLDQPIFVQFADYVTDTLTGDFRVSTSVNRMADIQDFIWNHVGNTLALLSTALVGSFMLGALLERLASSGRGRVRPLVIHGLSLGLLFIPAISLSMFFLMANVELDLGLPLRGDGTAPGESGEFDLSSVAEAAFLPVLTAVLSTMGLAVLILREGRMRSPGGCPERGECLRAFTDGLVRLRPFAHFHVAWTMSVVLMVDIVFSYGGLGKVMWDALMNLDFPVVMAVSFIAPMMVIAASSLISLALYLLSGRPARESLNDWGRRDPASASNTKVTSAERWALEGWTLSASRRFRSSRVAMSAAVLLLALIIVGILAPVLAPVPDPADHEYFEPNVLVDGWVNPLPPSLDKSPYTDLLHLLGTDHIGRDVLSMWLFALRDAVLTTLVLMAAALAIGTLIGYVAAHTADIEGSFARIADFLLTPFARVAVATPLIVLIAARLIAVWSSTNSSLLTVGTITALGAFYAWAWLLIVRPVRAEARSGTDGVARAPAPPLLLSEALFVAKFAVPFVLATRFSAAAIGLGPPNGMDFGSMVEMSLNWGVYISGDWHLILPPLLGMVLVCATAFVLLDRAEHSVRMALCQTAKEADRVPA